MYDQHMVLHSVKILIQHFEYESHSLVVHDPKTQDSGHSWSPKIHLRQWLQVHCLVSVKIKDVDFLSLCKLYQGGGKKSEKLRNQEKVRHTSQKRECFSREQEVAEVSCLEVFVCMYLWQPRETLIDHCSWFPNLLEMARSG